MATPTHEVHTAVRQSCALLVSLTERMQPDLSPLKPRSGSTWQSEIDQLVALLVDSGSRGRVQSCVRFAAALLLSGSVDYAKGTAHAIAGGSLYSGHALQRCVSEGLGMFHWMAERPAETPVLLGRALRLLIESHKQEEKRARLAVEAGEGEPGDDLEALRDSHAASAFELEAALRELGIDETLPRKSDAVASLTRAARMSSLPTIEYRAISAFTHLEPLVLFNSLGYKWQTSDGRWHQTMSVTGLLTPIVAVVKVLRVAVQTAGRLFEFTIGADPFDELAAQLHHAYLNYGQEQGADLLLR